MKSKAEIKAALHKLIDSIEDEGTLNMLNEAVIPYIIENKTNISENEELSEEELSQLDQAIKEADAGEVVGWDEFLKEIGTWRTK